MKLNNEIQVNIPEHIEPKKKVEGLLEEKEQIEIICAFDNDLISDIQNKNLIKRMNVVNELISKEDSIIGFIKEGLQEEDYTGDKELCLRLVEDLKEKREEIVSEGNHNLKRALATANNKSLLKNVVKGIEGDTRQLIRMSNSLVNKYVNGLKEKSEFYKKCHIKVKTTHGLLYIGIELLIFFGTLLIIYLIKK